MYAVISSCKNDLLFFNLSFASSKPEPRFNTSINVSVGTVPTVDVPSTNTDPGCVALPRPALSITVPNLIMSVITSKLVSVVVFTGMTFSNNPTRRFVSSNAFAVSSTICASANAFLR